MRSAINALLTLVLLSSVVASVAGQAGRPISVSLGTGLPMPIGKTVKVTVTVSNTVNSTVQLTFVGLRWTWMRPTSFFIGNNSEKGTVLPAGGQIKYAILVTVPSNTTAGTYTLTTYVSYRWFRGGNWTAVIGDVWVSNVPLAYPPSQSSTTTTVEWIGSTPPQTFSLETIAILVAVVGISLFLERRHVKGLFSRFRKTPTERSVIKVKPKTEKRKRTRERVGKARKGRKIRHAPNLTERRT